MKILLSVLVVAFVLLTWVFLTPMLFSHGSSAAFQMGIGSILMGFFFIVIAIINATEG